ncbi:CARF [Mytilus coruscus]|uniref:CARF n=1 Tax=Mytilus coruscus TaxID=42192 RepID=A0A6J8A1H5_MYTCO|nr:CARF [Mytilus coruscus]
MNTRRSSKKRKATSTLEAASRQEETQLQPGPVPASNDPSTSGGSLLVPSFDVVNRPGNAISKDHSNLTQTPSYSPSLDDDITFHVSQNLKQKKSKGRYMDTIIYTGCTGSDCHARKKQVEMFVFDYSKVTESIDLHENSNTSAFVSHRSENKRRYSSKTFPSDEIVDDKKRIHWSKAWEDGLSIPYDGVPFIIVGHEDFECHHGQNHKERMDFHRATGILMKVREINDHYVITKVEGMVSEWQRREMAKKIKHRENLEKEGRFYIFFPSDDQHENHLTGEASR